jgi:hypothetical protein
MAGSIEDNAAIYNKHVNKYVQPSDELIDCSVFAIDFAERKFINIGLDPTNAFNVAVRIITSTRHVCISVDLLRRIYSMMGYILSIISDRPVKSRERLFLKDEVVTLSKMAYRGDNMFVIESHRQDGCRVQLSRQNLLFLQNIEGCINETIALKTSIHRPVVMNQLDRIATYLKADFYREKTSSLEEITLGLTGIHIDLITSGVPTSNAEPNFIYQIVTFAAAQLAECWTMKLHNEPSSEVIIICYYYKIIIQLFSNHIVILFLAQR